MWSLTPLASGDAVRPGSVLLGLLTPVASAGLPLSGATAVAPGSGWPLVGPTPVAVDGAFTWLLAASGATRPVLVVSGLALVVGDIGPVAGILVAGPMCPAGGPTPVVGPTPRPRCAKLKLVASASNIPQIKIRFIICTSAKSLF